MQTEGAKTHHILQEGKNVIFYLFFQTLQVPDDRQGSKATRKVSDP